MPIGGGYPNSSFIFPKDMIVLVCRKDTAHKHCQYSTLHLLLCNLIIGLVINYHWYKNVNFIVNNWHNN